MRLPIQYMVISTIYLPHLVRHRLHTGISSDVLWHRFRTLWSARFSALSTDS